MRFGSRLLSFPIPIPLSGTCIVRDISKTLAQCATNNFRTLTRLYSTIKMSQDSQTKWVAEKTRILNLPIEEKRSLYKSHVTVYGVDPWPKHATDNKVEENRKHTLDDLTEFKKITLDAGKSEALAGKVSIFKGDITKLEIDAIVNAANSRLKAGGGVDGAIHRAAGPLLQEECNSLKHCATGDAKATGGYNLPAKYVIHTVGPQDGSASALQSCYEKSLSIMQEYKLKTIAFPCISTGIYGFPNRLAAHIALRTVRKYLETNSFVERVIFCTFMPVDVEIYETLMQMYFPLHKWNYVDGPSVTE